MSGIATRLEAKERRVALFGEVLFDEFPDGHVLGGAPFNVARHLRGLGLDPLLVSRVGDDALGAKALGTMAAIGLDTTGVQLDPTYPTGRVRVVLDGDAHRFELPANQAYDHIQADPAQRAVAAARPAAFYWGTLAQRGEVSQGALVAALDAVASTRIVDVNLRAPWYDVAPVARSFRAADVVKLNRVELDSVSNMLGVGAVSESELVRRLVEFYALNALVVTDGPNGLWLTTADGHVYRARGSSVDGIVDTVGAGDAVSAVLIAGEILGWAPEETIERADALARAVCRIRGAVPESDAFYDPFLREWNAVAQ
jgi:fructokinase